MSCRESFVVNHSALTDEDLRRADAIPHQLEMMAEGHTVGLRAILEFHNWCVRPLLNTLVNPTQKSSRSSCSTVALGFWATHCWS